LTVEIDRTLCVGFGDCIELGPDLFEFDDDGIVRFRAGCEATARETLIAACNVCPVDALVVYDAGVRIVP
jgi:ferredoxin